MAEEKVDLKELKKLLNPLSLLYVEDNAMLQEKASSFFEKLFGTVYRANDGHTGVELFKEHRPSIVITDIQMPLLDGLSMAQAIRAIDANSKIIVTSAYDEKSYLLKTIELGLNGYLVKPLKVEDLAALLYTIASQMSEERNKAIFHNYLYSIFNNQDNLLMMLKNDNVILANEHTLSFFQCPSLVAFKEKFKSFDTLLLPHDSFLYRKANSTISCLEYAKGSIDKLYNVKMVDQNAEPHHFILKLTHISDGENFYILSLTDITQLNLLSLYDKNSLEHDKALQDQKTIYNLLEAAREGGAVLKLYNFYKGLTICNNAVLSRVTKESFTCKTSIMQQKAAQIEQKIIINCELFPYDMQSLEIKDINFRFQTIEVGPCKMLKSTPVERKYLILEPDAKHKVSLFYNKHKFHTHMSIINISVESSRLFMEYLPAGFKENDEITLDMVFSDDIKPYIINTKAIVFKIIPMDKAFHIVAKLVLESEVHKTLIDYMASRQMKLVREFKGLLL
jgi:YesN/AraC family two-component response regulator